MKTLSTILLLLINISMAYGEEGIIPKLIEYDVNVIIFEDAHARYLNAEQWHTATAPGSDKLVVDETPASVLAGNLDKLSINDINDTAFKNIRPKILNSEYRRINNSSEYKVLFYASWRQTGLDENKAYEINIKQLNNNHKSISKNSITGNFKLVLARYLHMYGELEYHRQATTPATGNTVANPESTALTENRDDTFAIQLHRKMRSKELHYIDHPLVGILIQINPVENKPDEKSE